MAFIDQVNSSKNQWFEKVGKYLLTRNDLIEKLENENKSLEQCASFIISEVKKKAESSAICLTDEEVYSIAVHYYDEENLEPIIFENIKAEVKTSSVIKSVSTKSKSKKEKVNPNQFSLFDYAEENN